MRRKGLFMRGTSQGHDILVPVNSQALETIREVDQSTKVLCWVHKARYPEHHALAFAVMQKLADGCGVTVEVVLLSLKYETGRWDWVELISGAKVKHPRSIAFESMAQADFQKFWDDAIAVIKDKWLTRPLNGGL